MIERFLGDAFRSVRYAEEEAKAMGAVAVDQEHPAARPAAREIDAHALGALGLSLGESRERAERLAEDALASLGISLEDVRERIGIDVSLSVGGAKRLPFPARPSALSTMPSGRPSNVATAASAQSTCCSRSRRLARNAARLLARSLWRRWTSRSGSS